MLEQNALNVIKDTLQTELLKRGFLAPITISETTGSYPKIEVRSEPFQTVPVIMKSLMIKEFSGSITEDTVIRTRHGKECEITIYRLWIDVNVRYEHFDSGSNGVTLFKLTGWVTNEKFDDRIYELKIS